MGSLTRTEKSLVAIARALAVEAEIIVLDEPTASLPADEVTRLVAVLRRLRGRNVGMIYVSHRLDEVFEVADEVAVLRDGRLVGPQAGRRDHAPRAGDDDRRPAARAGLRPSGDQRQGRGAGACATCGSAPSARVSLTLRAGEMLGLVGLRGAGQEQVGRALFGLRRDRCRHRQRCPARRPISAAPGRGHARGDRSRRRRSHRREPGHAAQRAREPVPQSRPPMAGATLDWRRPSRRTAPCEKLCGRFGVRPSDPDPAGGDPLGRQPAEGGDRPLARDREEAADPGGADGRRRRRRQGRDLCPAQRRARARARHPGDRHRLRGGGQHLPPRPGVQSRPGGGRDRPATSCRSRRSSMPPRPAANGRAERVAAHA